MTRAEFFFKKHIKVDKGFMKNFKKPVARVYHDGLKRFLDGDFESVCPFCSGGILIMRWDKNLLFMPSDHCLHCGQHVYYVDVKEICMKWKIK